MVDADDDAEDDVVRSGAWSVGLSTDTGSKEWDRLSSDKEEDEEEEKREEEDAGRGGDDCTESVDKEGKEDDASVASEESDAPPDNEWRIISANKLDSADFWTNEEKSDRLI